MRILWHGIGPWHKTAYGVLTALFAPLLADLGHEVVIAFMGRKGIDDDPAESHPEARRALETGLWPGLPGNGPMRVIGPGATEFGLPSVSEVCGAFSFNASPDVVIVLKDPWVLTPEAYKRYPRTYVWTNIDCDPLGTPDRLFFERAGASVVPVAVSEFGQRMLAGAGFAAGLIPHGIDPELWNPGEGKAAARKLLDLRQDDFLVGINATNVGPRKAWGEQFDGFARFARRYPGRAILLVHTVKNHGEGIDLEALARARGISGSVAFGSHVNMRSAQMASWYRSLDVLLACTYGEGFAMPVIESIACGTPVIGADNSAVSEKIDANCGWLVPCQRWWNPVHEADWAIPNVNAITTALVKASKARPKIPPEIRHRYDAPALARQWDALLTRVPRETMSPCPA
jgi:glycosyltransferase involved in cell wall biosynthesis